MSTLIGKVKDLRKQIDELSVENELLSKAYVSAEEEKKNLYLDSLLAGRSYAKAHFGDVRDWTRIKKLEEHDTQHTDLSHGTFTHI